MTLINRGKHKGVFHNDDREIHVTRDIKNRRVGRKPLNDAALGVDRVNLSVKAVLNEAL